MKRDIPYYSDYVTDAILEQLLKEATPVVGVKDLVQIGEGGGLETKDSLAFLCQLYDLVKVDLNRVLNQRIDDRRFIDQQTRAHFHFNQKLKRDFATKDYQTILGLEDSKGRIVIGPLRADYHRSTKANPVAAIPEHLQGIHVTLFGPPDDSKLSINAMNAYHRKLKGEPAIIEELLSTQKANPFWGADDEDSKTPLREDLISAGVNLTGCFEGNIEVTDNKTGKSYKLQKDHLSLPIKRFPGLALPSFFLLYKENPLPLHLYDFALHLFRNWNNPKALAFYVPKLENEEEARYVKLMIEHAEKLIQSMHPTYKLGTIRLMIVLENPRAVFRVHEIIDELHPYFVGASLGWHDYLASTARLFKEDGNYRIPVKADPNIVIKYIKASHELLANVVGSRGGIKVGGMYGILPTTTDLSTPSFQITLKGYIKDVITQMKRDLSGFWVAHPDFVRLGLAMVESWKFYLAGDKSKLETLVKEMLAPEHHQEILDFIHGPDIEGLDRDDPLYPRSLIVADIKESTFIANNHPDEIRYNVFQSLQYLTDWLSGNGCVALPADIKNVPVRVMDDLATAERSRWEVWHELYHGRFSVEEFLIIAHEELHFIRKDLSNEKKIVQVKWSERTEKWYPVAFNLMVKLMTDKRPVEFATELLLPFTLPKIREANDPWSSARDLDADKFSIDSYVERFNYYFSLCGAMSFAQTSAQNLIIDLAEVENLIMDFTFEDILSAASFHGDIGESKKTLDHMASSEQSLVFSEEESLKLKLKELGESYKQKFQMKFLVSAQGKTGQELLDILQDRMKRSKDEELHQAKIELFLITKKRLLAHPINLLEMQIQDLLVKHNVHGASLAISTGIQSLQSKAFGESVKGQKRASSKTLFELASLSKSVGSCFALEYFKKKNISLDTPVNQVLKSTQSTFRLVSGDALHPEWADQVTLAHLMNHSALNMHYVNGVPANLSMPKISEFLEGNERYGYPKVMVINPPGEKFQYSGGGFLVLEHLIEALENKSIVELINPFLLKLGMNHFHFEQHTLSHLDYAHGYTVDDIEIPGTRKMFPAFAAGAMGTAHDMQLFLDHLTIAYRDLKGSGSISHDTAVTMLYGRDLGSVKFMNAKMGLGIFITEAGDNRLAIHQGANDGFRSLFVHCFDGPDRGLGFTIMANGELNAVLFISEVAQLILKDMKLRGIDYHKFKKHFSHNHLTQEEVVNIGYKSLVFDAFTPQLPEVIIDQGPLDPLAQYNLAVGSRMIEVTDQKFARAENLFSDHLPIFSPDLFGRQGKIMDSWETVRHNFRSSDQLIFEIQKSSPINYVSFSTKYHFGNQVPELMLEGFDEKKAEWVEVVPRIGIEGHAQKRLKIDGSIELKKFRLSVFPDGGLSRIGLYSDLPESEALHYALVYEAKSEKFSEEIPKTTKPLSTPYHPDKAEIERNYSALKSGDEFDVASSAFGGRVLFASNEHYGPAIQTISPYSPMHMFDGFESARSRKLGHHEELLIQLGRSSRILCIEMDFSFFVNNNPLLISLYGHSDGLWIQLADKVLVKPFAGNKKQFQISNVENFEQIKVVVHPDGGINRISVLTRFSGE